MSASAPFSNPTILNPPARTEPARIARVPRPLREGRLYWWHFPLLVGLLSLGIWIARAQWIEIYDYATKNPEYSHILLTLPVAALLVWVRRLRLRHFKVRQAWMGVLLVLAGLMVRSRGLEPGGPRVLEHAGSVIVAIGCVVAVLGRSALTRFFPAVLVLAFLIPVPDRIRQDLALNLQNWTAHITQAILSVFGVVTKVVGNTLEINGKQLQVAEACNGMRLVFPLVLITFVFAFSIPLRNGIRAVLLLASPLVALVCNVIRTVPTVWVHGQFPDGKSAFPDQFHTAAGWAMLPLAFVVLLVFIRLLRWAQLPIQRYTLASQ